MKIFYTKALFLLLSMMAIGYTIGFAAYTYLVNNNDDYSNKFSNIDKVDKLLFALANNQKNNYRPLVLSIGTSHCKSLLANSYEYDSVNLTFNGINFFASKPELENIKSLHMFDVIVLCTEPLDFIVNTSHNHAPTVTYNPTKFDLFNSLNQGFRFIDSSIYLRDMILELHQAQLMAFKKNQQLLDFDLSVSKRIAAHRSQVISYLPKIEKKKFHAVTRDYLKQKNKCVFLLKVPLHEKYLKRIPKLAIEHHGTKVHTINIPENYLFLTEQKWYKDGDHLNPIGMDLFSHNLETFLKTAISHCYY